MYDWLTASVTIRENCSPAKAARDPKAYPPSSLPQPAAAMLEREIPYDDETRRRQDNYERQGPICRAYRQSQGVQQWPSVCSVDSFWLICHHGNFWSTTQNEHELINY